MMDLNYWLLAAAGLILLAVFLVRPGRIDPNKEARFRGRCYAHRGLHDPDGSCPENSLAAFEAAAAAGYGIELDLQLSADGQVVVFHDRTLDRMTGTSGRVEEYTAQQLRSMHLMGTHEGIPLFQEVLAQLDGRVPLILELKSGTQNRQLCEKTRELLREYSGDCCIESFDPRILRWFKENAPHILRGQLADCSGSKGRMLTFFSSRMLANWMGRPQFIAWPCGKKNCMLRLCEAFGPMKICWNVSDLQTAQLAQQEYDAVVFEYCRPEPRY